MPFLKDFHQHHLLLWELHRKIREPEVSPLQSPTYDRPVFSNRRGTKQGRSGEARCQWASLRKCQGDGGFDDATTLQASSTVPRMKKVGTYAALRPSLRTFDTGSSTSGLSKSTDRFLPTRRSFLQPAVQSFHVNKNPLTLSTEEKLNRHPIVSLDSFNPRHRRRTATAPVATLNQPNRRRNPWATQSGGGGGASVLSFQRETPGPDGERQVSVGTIWTVGGLAPVTSGVPNGRGGLLGSGTNARLYTTLFSNADAKSKEDSEKERFENRISDALHLDRISRVFEFRDPSTSPSKRIPGTDHRTSWNGTEWVIAQAKPKPQEPPQDREIPTAPFKVLDASNLRDDFYCSVLAYSPTCHTLAVGLGSLLYGWSEKSGVRPLNPGNGNGSWLTSVAFSSPQGCKAILAFGRSDGSVNLMSLYDSLLPRFEVQQPCPIACVTWRPVVTVRRSKNPNSPCILVKTEDLLIGDEIGNVYYYSVEWPELWEVSRDGWSGSMTLLLRISIHTQQICGMSFSRDGSLFATGGNDNLCCLFETQKVLKNTDKENSVQAESSTVGPDGTRRTHMYAGGGQVRELKSGAEVHRWVHGAAVKAIAFCPWRDGLIATGGGSNDKCIHFYHALSGACLATISVAAQVTSLIWSTTRREICATFGYAQPEHPYRIAVFSWPDCKQVTAIPWEGEHRALYAIPYPGGPNESQTSKEGGKGLTRTDMEGCIVVASSDESVKFHEVWTASPKATVGGTGSLGGSDILEGLEGIDKEGEIIR